MPRQSRAATLNPQPSYPAWKADAVKALQKLHERAARVTRDGFWTRCYVRNLSPEKAAELAAQEYESTHRPKMGEGEAVSEPCCRRAPGDLKTKRKQLFAALNRHTRAAA
jgi:hypothetical protein